MTLPETAIELIREVEAIEIPSGDILTLPKGMSVYITQALGGTYTVSTASGLARISSENADALGLTAEDTKSEAEKKLEEGDVKGAVWEQLKMVFDPEIPINIVDLGLVYDCELSDENKQTIVTVKMTLTAPGCGMGPAIAADARQKIISLKPIDDARVDIVWDPPWNQDMITLEGKMKLGMV